LALRRPEPAKHASAACRAEPRLPPGPPRNGRAGQQRGGIAAGAADIEHAIGRRCPRPGSAWPAPSA
jgi:hypothetical protein